MSKIQSQNPLKTVFGSVILLTVIFFLQFLIRLLAGPLLPSIKAELSLSHAQSGVFILLTGVGIFFAQLFAPFIAAKWGYRRCILLSLFGASAAALIVGFSRPLWALNVGYVLLGCTAGLYAPSGISLITVLVHTRDWGKAMGIHEIAPNLGLICAPLVATLTLQFGTWRNGYIFLSMILAILWLVYLFSGIDSAERPNPPDLVALKAILPKSSFWKISALLSIGIGIETGVYAMIPLFFVNERNFTLIDANHLLSLSRIPGIFMVILSGWLTDRLNAFSMVRIIYALNGIAVVLLGICPPQVLQFLIYFQAAASASLFPPLLSMISNVTTSGNRALMLSWTLAIAPVVGGGIIPALIGVLGDYGTFSSGFIFTGILALFGIMMIPASKKMQG